MKNKVWLFTAALLLFTAGCGEPDMAQNKINSNEQKQQEFQIQMKQNPK